MCSHNFDMHLELLLEVAKCLKFAGLTINIGKSKFCQLDIKYLGCLIGSGFLKVDPEKVENISQLPITRTPRQVIRFIGMAHWYRSLIFCFSDLAGPLTDCLKKTNKPFYLSIRKIKDSIVEGICSRRTRLQ